MNHSYYHPHARPYMTSASAGSAQIVSPQPTTTSLHHSPQLLQSSMSHSPSPGIGKQPSPEISPPQHLSQVMSLTDNCNNALEDARGFPTPQQFEDILNDYIASLSPKKRDKALIGQKRYDNILAVLRDPRCTTIESAQFRFWAKKMFRLGPEGPESNLVHHEGKPVAVRESLYRILVDAHSRANHGGRDKTSTEVRKNFAW